LWTGVHVVQLDYDFIANTTSSTDDPRLKELLFADCANNAFHVLILLEDKTGADAGQLKIRLGNSNEFKDGCAAAKLSSINLIDNSERRVESSKMPGKLLTIAESQKLFVGLYVRSISVVVGPGSPAKAENYKVKLLEANVNGVKATDSLLVIDPTSYRKLTKLPLTGRHVLISEQNKPLNTPVAELADDQIKNVENQFQAQLPKSLTPGVAYRVDLCLSGGRCVPLQGSFTLPKE